MLRVSRLQTIALLAVFISANAIGSVYQIQIPLENGRLSLADLSDRLSGRLHLPSSVVNHFDKNLSVNVQGISGWPAIKGINRALGDGFSVSVSDNSILVS